MSIPEKLRDETELPASALIRLRCLEIANGSLANAKALAAWVNDETEETDDTVKVRGVERQVSDFDVGVSGAGAKQERPYTIAENMFCSFVVDAIKGEGFARDADLAVGLREAFRQFKAIRDLP